LRPSGPDRAGGRTFRSWRLLVNFKTFIGPTTFTHVLFVAALAIAIGDLLATLFTLFYQRFFYTKTIRPNFSQGFAPRCSIIVPCKGVPKNFGKTLEGFIDLDYENYEVVYVTESENDPAAQVIRSILDRHANARLVVAGFAQSCSQKNHNLLAGISETCDPEVYVFADADIQPGKQWLRELILPLGDPRIAVTSGFRWLRPTKGTVGEFTHAYANIFIYVLFNCASFFGGEGLWGGSMAIRRKDFELLGVAEKWTHAVVDDISLSRLIYKKRLKGIIVPLSFTHSDELFSSVKASIVWFERQIMYLKVYFKTLWLFAILPVLLVSVLLLFLLPVSIVKSLSTETTFFAAGGGAALVYYIGELLAVSLYPLLGSVPRFHRFLLFWPFMRCTQAVSYVNTLKTNTITWSGVRYRLKFFGDVHKVER
jgi:ceramide glucosyltransferase